MRIPLATSLAAAVSILSVAPAAVAADDPYVGSFTTSCARGLTCYADVARTGKGRYTVKWEAATKLGETICTQEFKLKSGPFEKEPGLVMQDIPSGRMQDKSRIMMMDMPDAQLYLWSDGSPCENDDLLGVNGVYYAYGDI